MSEFESKFLGKFRHAYLYVTLYNNMKHMGVYFKIMDMKLFASIQYFFIVPDIHAPV